MRAARTFYEFDNLVTAPLHGFRDTDDYWTRASSAPCLERIRVPTLLLNARNDPFLPEHELEAATRKAAPCAGARISAQRRPLRLPQRALPRPPQLAAATPVRILRIVTVPAEIFRTYDIRGIVGKTLTPAIVRDIGRALGTFARSAAPAPSPSAATAASPARELAGALAEGLNAAGADVIDIGMAPTPVAYFAAHHLGCGSCVAVTGSHNPPDYNGLKIVVAGNTLYGDEIQELAKDHRKPASSPAAKASAARRSVLEAYVDRITSDVKLARKMRIAVDCGNGVAGMLAPQAVPRARLRGRGAVLRGGRALSRTTIPTRRCRRTSPS